MDDGGREGMGERLWLSYTYIYIMLIMHSPHSHSLSYTQFITKKNRLAIYHNLFKGTSACLCVCVCVYRCVGRKRIIIIWAQLSR